ncbi:MAG: glycosyltransferase [Prevotellaceae bacterium]|nr:glycosyltransferase [Candidatus Minthosoma equi]
MKISIITATYNSGSTLRDTLDSILRQSYTDYEVIIQDGCSRDNTLDIIKEYEPIFGERMKWVSEKDNGLYDAMNRGISRATGDVVGILNSDDFYTSDNILGLIADGISNVDAVYGDIHFVKDDDLNKCVRYYSSKNFRPWRMRWGYMPAHPSFYCRREVYEKNGLFSLDYKLAADYDILIRFLCKAKIKTKYLPLDMVTMRTGGASTKNISNRLLLTKEDAIACRRNGIYSNFLMCSCKYLTKIFEFL